MHRRVDVDSNSVPRSHQARVGPELGEAALERACLVAALEAIEAPAVILTSGGQVRRSNAAARELLARDPEWAAAVHSRSRRIPPDAGYYVAPIATEGSAELRLVVVRETRPDRSIRVAVVARQWGLTFRQIEVLHLLAAGHSNKEMAIALGCSVRTVDVHLGAVMMKARAATRTELLAILLGET